MTNAPDPTTRTTRAGDILFLSDTHLLVLTNPKPSPRDGNWRIRVQVQNGEWKGQQLWMVSDHASGPWETPGAGFV
jgi:hypothetical protein